MLFNKNIIVLFSLLFAAACGNGDGNGPAPCDCQGKADSASSADRCACPNPDGGTDGTDGQVPLTCPNRTCDEGETCGNCLSDCPCSEGEECQEGKCRVKPYECPYPDTLPAECVPEEYREAFCDTEFADGKCNRGRPTEIPCLSDSDCQSVPSDQWPPCVCWQFCGYAGEWKCTTESSLTITIAESPDGTYCDIDINNGAYKLIGMPDNPPPRYPLDDHPVHFLKLTNEGVNFSDDGSFVFHCTAVTE